MTLNKTQRLAVSKEVHHYIMSMVLNSDKFHNADDYLRFQLKLK